MQLGDVGSGSPAALPRRTLEKTIKRDRGRPSSVWWRENSLVAETAARTLTESYYSSGLEST